MENKEFTNEDTPGWLEELQIRSWEPEVLLSGIVLYGMFKTPGLLDSFLNYFQANISSVNDLSNLIAILKVGTYWLISGLILHLISRGIWVGMVGISYTFPAGINRERIKFKGRFIKKIENIPPFQKIIINLEKVCSALFSLSFMLFMCVIGGYLYIFILMVVPVFSIIYFFPEFVNTGVFQAWILLVLIMGFIAFIDFITLGYFKRFKWISRIYWPIDVVISTLTLSRFYRPIYYTFVSNLNRWVIALAFILFAVISFFGLGSFSGTNYAGDDFSRLSLWHNRLRTAAFSGYYDDQNETKFSTQAQIQSDIIDGNVVKLFIPAAIDRELRIKEYVNYDSLRKLDDKRNPDQFDLDILKNYYTIWLDDQILHELPWYFHYKMKTEQRGYLVYINIAALDRGMHSISVGGPQADLSKSWASIPFYRDLPESDIVPANDE